MTLRKIAKLPYEPGNTLSLERTEAAHTLCRALIKSFGGFSAVARMLDTSRQHIFEAQKYGHVALPIVYSMSKALNVSQWALSYVKLYQIFGKDSPSLEQVIADSPLLPEEKRGILRLIKPLSLKEKSYGEASARTG